MKSVLFALDRVAPEYRTDDGRNQTDDGTTGEPDGVVDSNDPWYYFCYDDNWRIVATFRDDDANPKEVFVHHNAGLGGYGGSSYIDDVILRDRDANTAWYEAADSTREERRYYVQNWRADVSAVLTDAGKMVEWVKYSAYGVPFALPAGDTDSDGDWNATDACYEYDPTFEGAGRQIYHVRHRVYDADVGRWTRQDPLGHLDGMSLYAYTRGQPLTLHDAWGLRSLPCAGNRCIAQPDIVWPHPRDPMPALPPPCPTPAPGSLGPSPGPGPASSPPTTPPAPTSPPDVFDWRSCLGFAGCTGAITRKPGARSAPNGCGSTLYQKALLHIFFPAFIRDFTPCCNNHDSCYGSCGVDKNKCDQWFFDCLMNTCDTLYGGWFNKYTLNHKRCIQSAELFYRAVRDNGKGAFCVAQQKNCKCNGVPGAPPPQTTPTQPPSLPDQRSDIPLPRWPGEGYSRGTGAY